MTTTDPAINTWSNDNLSDLALEETTHGSGTTAQRTAISSWSADRPFFDADEAVWYYNSHVSAPGSITWTQIGTGFTEFSTTPITDDAEITSLSGDWIGEKGYQLGSAGELYTVTHIEFKSGTSTNSTYRVVVGLFKVDAETPVDTSPFLIAYGDQIVPLTSTTHKVELLGAPIVDGAEWLFPAMNTNNANVDYRSTAGASAAKQFVESFSANPAIGPHAITWLNNSNDVYVKLYYRRIA